MTARNPDVIGMHDLVYLKDRPYKYRVTGVHKSPHGRTYKLAGGTIWYRETELRPTNDPDRMPAVTA